MRESLRPSNLQTVSSSNLIQALVRDLTAGFFTLRRYMNGSGRQPLESHFAAFRLSRVTLSEIGRQASHAARCKALLSELRRCKWNLTVTGESLGVGSPANVLRAIKSLGLEKEYGKAKQRGLVSPGSRR